MTDTSYLHLGRRLTDAPPRFRYEDRLQLVTRRRAEVLTHVLQPALTDPGVGVDKHRLFIDSHRFGLKK